jgi:hypothetical protein
MVRVGNGNGTVGGRTEEELNDVSDDHPDDHDERGRTLHDLGGLNGKR